MSGSIPTHPVFPEDVLLRPRFWRNTETNVSNASASDLMWSPNGSPGAYVITESRESEPDDFRTTLCCIGADGRNARRLYSCSTDDETTLTGRVQTDPEAACWSPDSRRILFWKRFYGSSSSNADGSPLFDVAIGGGVPRMLTTPFRRTDGYHDDGMMRKGNPPLFSPDGRRLLLVVGYGRFFVENKRLASLDYPSGRRIWLTDRDWAVTDVAWSPSGRQIGLTMTEDRGRVRDTDDILRRSAREHLWVMNADGPEKRRLTDDPRYRESAVEWVGAPHLRDPAPSLRFVRSDNTDIGPNVRWESLRSQWEIRSDGTGPRRIRSLPPIAVT